MKRASLTDDIFKTGESGRERTPLKPRSSSETSQHMHASAGMPASTPPPQAAVIKKTYYFDQETLAILERERYRRRASGERVGSDFSALIREAVKKTFA